MKIFNNTNGWKTKIFNNTNLAFLTSVLILISAIYSLIVNIPLYKFTLSLHTATMTMSIITLAIHINAFKENKENKERRKLILLSLVVPIAMIIYFAIGIYSLYSGN